MSSQDICRSDIVTNDLIAGVMKDAICKMGNIRLLCDFGDFVKEMRHDGGKIERGPKRLVM